VYTNDLFGKEVLDTNANRVGKVADIDVDLLQGIVYHFTVKAGLTKKYIIGLDKIHKIGDKIILTIAQEDLK
jgi:sporulation protein YlmC with PRC-barrel domain